MISEAKAGSRPAAAMGSTNLFSAVGRVVEVHDELVAARSYEPDASIVQKMMERGMRELTGKSSWTEAWRSFVFPDDVVGVKLNVTGRFHPPEILCDPAIPEICAHLVLRDKAVLHILDAIHAQCNGGPSGNPQWAWNYNSILFSTDPVALDHLGVQIIDQKRKAEGMPALADVGKAPRHIATAARMVLGTNDPGKIDHLKINLTETTG